MNKFRFIFDPCVGSGIGVFVSETYKTKEEAESHLYEVANYTLHLHKFDYMQDYSNYGLVQENEKNTWIDCE